jgi:hypothetical protein
MLLKTIIIFLSFLITIIFAEAQTIKQRNVPSIIVNALQLRFPKATNVDWELERGLYKAVFEIDDVDHEVRLDYNGQMMRHTHDFEEKGLPKAVKEAIENSFNGFEVHNVLRIVEGKNVFYKMKLEKSNVSRKVLFNEHGKIYSNREN